MKKINVMVLFLIASITTMQAEKTVSVPTSDEITNKRKIEAVLIKNPCSCQVQLEYMKQIRKQQKSKVKNIWHPLLVAFNKHFKHTMKNI